MVVQPAKPNQLLLRSRPVFAAIIAAQDRSAKEQGGFCIPLGAQAPHLSIQT
jgi:hypothetical protein